MYTPIMYTPIMSDTLLGDVLPYSAMSYRTSSGSRGPVQLETNQADLIIRHNPRNEEE